MALYQAVYDVNVQYLTFCTLVSKKAVLKYTLSPNCVFGSSLHCGYHADMLLTEAEHDFKSVLMNYLHLMFINRNMYVEHIPDNISHQS